jgi:amphi-Trp domain-containing protein
MALPQPAHFEQSGRLSRAEVAARLHELAEQIARGQLSFNQGTVFVAEQMAFEFEYESKHGKSELNIELEWR